MSTPPTAVRIDKWLWAVRLFKTRSQAIAECENGRILMQDQLVKPSRSVRVGDAIVVIAPGLRRTFRVLGLIDKRIPAREVRIHMEDLTPPEVYARAREAAQLNGFLPRPTGAGRPSKKDRRAMNAFENESEAL